MSQEVKPGTIIFRSTTAIHFQAEEDVEAFVKQMPWPPKDHAAMLKGDVIRESENIDFMDAKFPAYHKFQLIREGDLKDGRNTNDT